MPFFDEPLFSETALNPVPESSLIQAPSSGIGIAPEQAPAPVFDATRLRPLSRPEVNLDLKREAISRMSAGEKFFGALGEFGAAVQGRPSPLLAQIESRRRDRLLHLQEVKLFAETSKDVLNTADRLSGDARNKYIQAKADMLNSVSPGSGEMLKNFADDPEYGKLVLEHAAKSPTLKLTLETGGLRAARDLLKSAEGGKLIRGEIESAALPKIRNKLMGLAMAARELSTPEEYKKIMEDGILSPAEAQRLSERARGHEQYKALALSDSESTLASRHEEATYGLSGFATTKTAQQVLEAKGKEKPKLQVGEIFELPLGGKNFAKVTYDPDKTLFPQAERTAEGLAILGKGTKEGLKIEFPPTTAEVNREVGGKVHKFKIQISADGTVRETDMGEVKPLPKGGALGAIIDEALKNPKGAPKPAAKPSAKPPVPAELSVRFSADPAMEGKKLGAATAQGYEVRDAAGKLLGYYK